MTSRTRAVVRPRDLIARPMNAPSFRQDVIRDLHEDFRMILQYDLVRPW